MTHAEDLRRVHEMTMLPLPEGAQDEVAKLEQETALLEESGILEGFDPLDYTDPYANQNIPEGK